MVYDIMDISKESEVFAMLFLMLLAVVLSIYMIYYTVATILFGLDVYRISSDTGCAPDTAMVGLIMVIVGVFFSIFGIIGLVVLFSQCRTHNIQSKWRKQVKCMLIFNIIMIALCFFGAIGVSILTAFM